MRFAPELAPERPVQSWPDGTVVIIRPDPSRVLEGAKPASPDIDQILESQSPLVPETPIYLDENVQFTVYKPKRIRPQKWYALLAYAHLAERRPGEDEADPIERMEAEVERVLGQRELENYSQATEDSSQSVPRRGEITFVPFIAGIEFNPPSQSFLWQESFHGQQFRMLASAALDGKTARGQMSVFLGSILLAEINLSLRVDSTQPLVEPPLEKEKPARPYRKVFPSYSHKDIEIVAQIEHYAQISGDKYLRDLTELRSGQNWKEWMRETIEDADIFQLFWSTNSMRSQNVKLEWQHALSLRRQNFIRPTYWESPLPQSPADNLPPPELLDLHFQQVRAPANRPLTTAPSDSSAAIFVSPDFSKDDSVPWQQELQSELRAEPAAIETGALPAPPTILDQVEQQPQPPIQLEARDWQQSAQPMTARARGVASRGRIWLLAIVFAVLCLIGLIIVLLTVFR
jgi:hypothetical protein